MSKSFVKSGGKIAVISLVLGLAVSLVIWLLWSSVRTNKNDFDYETNIVSKLVQQQFDTVIIRIKDLAAFVSADMEDEVDTKLRQASRISNNLVELGYFYSDSRSDIKVYYANKPTLDVSADDYQKVIDRLAAQPGLVIAFAGGGSGMFRHIDPKDIIMMQSLEADGELGLRLGQSHALITYAVLDLDAIIEETTFDLRVSRYIEARYLVEGQSRRLGSPEQILSYATAGERRQISLVATRNLSLTLEFERSFGASLTVALFASGIIGLAAIAAGLFFVSERSHQRIRLRLRQAAEAEREANTAKSDFLATMSHEIRTPLNGVLGMAELLTRSELTPTQKRYAEQIRTSGSMLLGILNDILDMSKLESGKLAVDIVRMDLHENLRETVGFFVANAQDKGLSVLLDIDPDVPGIIGMDPMRLRQIVSNLVSNAIKFTEKGEVVVSANFVPTAAARGDLRISVSDSGIGMTTEECERLFQRFSQANSGTTRRYGGTGLGLAISKQLAEALGGSISVKSAPGKGSTFEICLPVDVHRGKGGSTWTYGSVALICDSQAVVAIVGKAFKSAGLQPAVFPYSDDLAKQLILGDGAGNPFSLIIFNEERDIHLAKDHWQAIRTKIIPAAQSIVLGNLESNRNYAAFDEVLVKPFIPATLVETAKRLLAGRADSTFTDTDAVVEKAKPVKQLFENRRLLLVDDNHVNLLIAEEYLARYGFAITTATNGVKAVKAAEDGDFDIIFMDCQMPEMDGYQATGIIRNQMADRKIRRVPIVALTANALKGDRERCLEAGMDDFLSKPLQDQALMGVFDRILETPAFAWLGEPIDARPPTQSAPRPVVKVAKLGTQKPDTGVEPPLARLRISAEASPPIAVQPNNSAPPSETAQSVDSSETFWDREADVSPAVSPPPAPLIPQTSAVIKPVVARPEPLAAVTAAPVSPASGSNGSAKVPLMDIAEFQRTRDAMKKFDLLLSLYRNDTADYLKAIREALTMQALDEAILPAHTIKSSSRMIGATGLSALSANMETRLRTKAGGSPAELQALLEKMDKVFDATLRQIDGLMAAPPMSAAG
ncbi:hybrid sensor histidine kinase/response regulator [Rhizobium sp. AAP43]|uniref:hybrid sensor histidine kinase/response regulator n=1 Tax=Rhizobium sp. AAP43 TaxID=1523420 RepID=UPI0006B8E9CB|nr:hybrid sensor histidine kinase/response regulator [Rhizobium sp. AAP43]